MKLQTLFLSLALAAPLASLYACGGGGTGGSGGDAASSSGSGGGSTSSASSGSGGASSSSGMGSSTSSSGASGGHDPGTLIGDFYITYYWMVLEADYSGADSTPLKDDNCAATIATVPLGFADDVCIEGSGKLTDGTVINYSSECNCGFPCSNNVTVCFALLDAAAFPWGQGSQSNALVPLRSWAVDNAVIPHGTLLYAPKWDGVVIPSIDGIGGFVHDGCFRADDVGNGINGQHYDFYAGSTKMWEALEVIHPSIDTHFDVYKNAPHCAYLGAP